MLASHEDALELLGKQGYTCTRVIQVDPDAILYLNGLGRARTCWLHVPERGPMRCQIESGFVIEPPAGWHDCWPGES